ncbi:MAG: SH3 domain-containing protein [Thermomicrobiales bacterium]|nr:SH3 domain-containing protein [Thermomicrobiales bacterium]
MLNRGLCPARRLLVGAAIVALTCGPLSHVAAQDGAPIIASGGEVVLLRDAPGWEAAALGELPDGTALQITGDPITAADGSLWSPVSANGAAGYIPAGYVGAGAPAEQAPAEAAWEPEAAELVADPVVADAAPAEAAPVVSPDPVVAQDPIVAPVAPVGAATVTESNLRSAPSADASIMQTLPPGTQLTVDGAAQNGFVPVTSGSASGWIAEELLGQVAAPIATDPGLAAPELSSATVTEPPPLVAPDATTATMAEPAPAENVPAPPPVMASETSTGIIWPMSGGEWKVVQGYNNGTHTNRSGFATYKYSLDWARSNGETAGQPIYAPVSGAIEWTDRGSGGILINAGNGYGVALFHVVLNRSGRGGSVTQGEQIGVVAGPGDPGYMNMTHFEIAVWKLNPGGGHESVPFDGPNAIGGQAFPDTGGTNQYMDMRVSP